jgi:hypothetical protein
VLKDLVDETKQKTFQPNKKISTWFVGETGRGSGLTREMWYLFGKDLITYCDGEEYCKIPRHDATKWQVSLLYVFYSGRLCVCVCVCVCARAPGGVVIGLAQYCKVESSSLTCPSGNVV